MRVKTGLGTDCSACRTVCMNLLIYTAVGIASLPSLLLGLLWHATGNLWAGILLHAWVDALYLGAAYAEAKCTHTGPSGGEGARSTE